MIPSVSIRKVDGNTGVVRPTDVGVGAIISTSELGTANQAEAFLQSDVALAEFGGGDLVELAAYTMPVSGNPVLLVKGTGSTPAEYGDVLPGDDNTGATVASAGGTDPLGDFAALITCTTAGTVGSPGIAYTYSLDDGRTTSAPQALGTDTSILIPDSGVTLDFTVATMALGDTYACATVGPKNTNGDLTDGLEALRLSRTPFEMVLYDGPVSPEMTAWAKGILTSSAAMGSEQTRRFDGVTLVAKVEPHTWTIRDGVKTAGNFRGVTLYRVS